MQAELSWLKSIIHQCVRVDFYQQTSRISCIQTKQKNEQNFSFGFPYGFTATNDKSYQEILSWALHQILNFL